MRLPFQSNALQCKMARTQADVSSTFLLCERAQVSHITASTNQNISDLGSQISRAHKETRTPVSLLFIGYRYSN